MRIRVAAAASMVLIVSGLTAAVVAEDTLRLCVKQGGQVRAIGPGDTCGNGESLMESAGALRFVDADGRSIGPWVDLNAVGFPIADPAAGDFWVLARAGRNFSKNVGEIDYDAPDCAAGGGTPYMLADSNALMRNGTVLEGRFGFTAPTLVYPANPVRSVVIKSMFRMSFNGTMLCENTGTGFAASVGPLASIEVAFTAPFKLVR
jgi:hypothetical protein